ncbi:hypothetical protein [Agromyces intestinalis]|uniref:hypothetical protein n=1 Tax=Agromyces intestinalis TaxID=2592652 RepID=UPI001FE98417|nr:hypothetical protein [Agromyces intestinalis]
MRETRRSQPGGRRVAPKSGATPVGRTRTVRRFGALLATFAVGGLLATLAIAPTAPPLLADPAVAASSLTHDRLQRVAVDAGGAVPGVSEDSYVASTGPETLIEGGTNHDWAKLVLVDGGFPVTEANVTVILRWMRQENGVDNWWNRNNPLNNGNGSGGGSGLGSYDTLVTGAYYAADSLRRYAFYDAIEAALEVGDDADATARAIWASPWAGSHYGNGTHWSTRPVEAIEAPASAWGR